MLGGSMSKLAKQGENLGKVRSSLFCLVVVGSSLLRVTSLFMPSTRVIKVSCFMPILIVVLSSSKIRPNKLDKLLFIKSKLSCNIFLLYTSLSSCSLSLSFIKLPNSLNCSLYRYLKASIFLNMLPCISASLFLRMVSNYASLLNWLL